MLTTLKERSNMNNNWLKPKINEVELDKNSVVINVIFSIEEIRERFFYLSEIDEFPPENFINFINLGEYFSIELLFYNFLVRGIDEEPDYYYELIEKSVELTYPQISINNSEMLFIFVLSKEKSICIRDFIKENYKSFKVAKLNKDTFQDFLVDLVHQIEYEFEEIVFNDYHDSTISDYLKRKLEKDKSKFIDW